jgi:hypothetical protein
MLIVISIILFLILFALPLLGLVQGFNSAGQNSDWQNQNRGAGYLDGR